MKVQANLAFIYLSLVTASSALCLKYRVVVAIIFNKKKNNNRKTTYRHRPYSLWVQVQIKI